MLFNAAFYMLLSICYVFVVHLALLLSPWYTGRVCFNIFFVYCSLILRNIIGELRPRSARELYEEARKGGHVLAAASLARLYVLPGDLQNARKCSEEACRSGRAIASDAVITPVF